jgi:hypothetical protein
MSLLGSPGEDEITQTTALPLTTSVFFGEAISS